MEENNKIEPLLSETQAPCIREGSHRSHLKALLIEKQGKEPIMMNGRKRLSWALAGLLLLTVTSWAATELYFTVCHEEKTITAPDGTESVESRSVVVTSDAPDYTEQKAKAQWNEVQELIAQGKYELLRVDEKQNGTKCYVYKFILSDGEEFRYATRTSLDSATHKNPSR